MNFDYVWGIIENCTEVPTTVKFTKIKNENKFYPLHHEGIIFTADDTLWKIENNAKTSYWPSANEITRILQKCKLEKYIVIILTDISSANTIDPNVVVELSRIPNDVRKNFEFVNAGFDVIDISGLSALTNIGYSFEDLSSLDNNLEATKYGLITSISDARKFTEFATKVAPEHSPFLTVKVNFIKL